MRNGQKVIQVRPDHFGAGCYGVFLVSLAIPIVIGLTLYLISSL